MSTKGHSIASTKKGREISRDAGSGHFIPAKVGLLRDDAQDAQTVSVNVHSLVT